MPERACILDCDSPSYPVELDEYLQCSCGSCHQYIQAQLAALTTELEQARQTNEKLHAVSRDQYDCLIDYEVAKRDLAKLRAELEQVTLTYQQALTDKDRELEQVKAERDFQRERADKRVAAYERQSVELEHALEERDTLQAQLDQMDYALRLRTDALRDSEADLTALRASSAALVDGIYRLQRFGVHPEHELGPFVRYDDLCALLPVSEGKQ